MLHVKHSVNGEILALLRGYPEAFQTLIHACERVGAVISITPSAPIEWKA